MFLVKHKETGELHTVYAVSGLSFLVYDGVWRWVEMKDFVPVVSEVAG